MKYGVKEYDTNFPLEHAQKDVRFAQALADDNGISMSVSGAANGMYQMLSIISSSSADQQYDFIACGYMTNRVVQSCQRSRVK